MNPRWRFGLLGENIAYTKSPEIFAAIAEYSNAAIAFEVIDCSAEAIPESIKRMSCRELDGLSVTIPHKEIMCSNLNQLSDASRVMGAVNCVARLNEKLVGHNTDWEGFLAPLKVQKITLANAKVVILGSGGAARAVAYGLQRSTAVSEIVVVSRDDNRISKFREVAGKIPVRFLPFGEIEQVSSILRGSDLVVNATPLGGGNAKDGGTLLSAFTERPGVIYYDLNYNQDNALLQRAAECGSKTIDGTAMLVSQALKSFSLWTGETAPFDLIFRKVFG